MITLWQNDKYLDPWAVAYTDQFVKTYQTIQGAPIVPIGDCEIEIMYPILPSAKSNINVFRKDSMEWRPVQKSEHKWRHEFVTLRFKVRDSLINDFYNFHVTNKGILVQLSTPGINPFIRSSEVNNVFIFDFSKPRLEKQKSFMMSVTYINQEIIPE